MARIINSLYIVFSLAKLKQRKNKVEPINHLMKNLYGVDDFYRIVFRLFASPFFTLGRNEDVFIFIKNIR